MYSCNNLPVSPSEPPTSDRLLLGTKTGHTRTRADVDTLQGVGIAGVVEWDGSDVQVNPFRSLGSVTCVRVRT